MTIAFAFAPTTPSAAGELVQAGPPTDISPGARAWYARIATMPGNRSVVAFHYPYDWFNTGLGVSSFDGDGQLESGPTEVVRTGTCQRITPNSLTIASADSGFFVLMWRCDTDDVVYVQPVGSDGSPVGNTVGVGTGKSDFNRRLVVDDSGFYVLRSVPGALKVRHYGTSGSPTDSEFDVLTTIYTAQQFYIGAVIPDGSGGLVVVWNPSADGIGRYRAGRFAADGTAITPAFTVEDTGLPLHPRPHLVGESDGGYTFDRGQGHGFVAQPSGKAVAILRPRRQQLRPLPRLRRFGGRLCGRDPGWLRHLHERRRCPAHRARQGFRDRRKRRQKAQVQREGPWPSWRSSSTGPNPFLASRSRLSPSLSRSSAKPPRR